MASSKKSGSAYVWIWLPERNEPVVAGRLDELSGEVTFRYAPSYLERADAISLYTPELPLEGGRQRPLSDLDAPGCILDSSPDAWGQRVIMNGLLGREASTTSDPVNFGRITFLLNSGSDRVGALDFQESASEYQARGGPNATLDELATSAQRVEAGIPLTPALDQALLHGSSVGGARPKALIDAGHVKKIAKFSSATDSYPVVQGEFIAMELARRAALDAAPVELVEVLGKKALLVDRFDRTPGAANRRSLVSALTILQLSELAPRYASYAELAQVVRAHFTESSRTLTELFSRITFNILVGNNDDHARNHAAFWDGQYLTLTPAYDIAPQPRNTGRATQSMMIGPNGFKESQLAGCVEHAEAYQVRRAEAREIIDMQIEVIRSDWEEVCDLARLTQVERAYFWKRQFLNSYALQDY